MANKGLYMPNAQSVQECNPVCAMNGVNLYYHVEDGIPIFLVDMALAGRSCLLFAKHKWAVSVWSQRVLVDGQARGPYISHK